MRLFQFVKWWWDNNDEFTRTVGCYVVVWALPCAVSTIWFGKGALLAILGGVPWVVAGWGLYGLFYWLRNMWKTFEDENPSEEVAIMRKLKGIPTPSGQKEFYYD